MSPSFPTRKLGKNGPPVTAIGMGLMGLSAFYGKPKPDDERMKFLDEIFESGELMWDSSDIYGDSEDLLGRWFKANPGKREKVFLATKFAVTTDPTTGARTINNTPEYIEQACEKSLTRLGIDHVDLYYCHRVNANQPIEVTVRAMKKLKDAGKVKYLGLSECSAETLRRACKVEHIDAVQVEYSPFATEIETNGLLEACRELGVAIVAYSPLSRGFLTGALRSPDDLEEGDFRKFAPRFSKENFPKNLQLVDLMKKIADQKGCTVGQVVLKYLLDQDPLVIPIPGTTKIRNFEENMGSLKVDLTPAEEVAIRKAIESVEVAGPRYPEAMASTLYVDTVPE